MKKATLLGVLLLALVCGISFAQGPGRQRFRSERENRTRQDNSAVLAEVLAQSGVTDFEVRLNKKQDGLKKAVETLKANFGGTDIEIK